MAVTIAIAIVTSSVPLTPFAPILDRISITASAAETENGLEYEVNEDGTLSITGYIGDSPNVVIPSEIDGKTVTVIGEAAFYETGIQTIVLNEGLERIESDAFLRTPITSVTFPKSLRFIGSGAFFECEKLNFVRLLNSDCEMKWNNNVSPFLDIDSDGYGCFLNTVYCPTGSEDYYYSYCFCGYDSNGYDESWTFVEEDFDAGKTIPNSTLTYELSNDGVLTITGNDTELPAFLDSNWNMTAWCGNSLNVKKVVFKATPNLTSIGKGAFYEFANLESIELPASLTTIGDLAFEACTSLKEINFPKKLTTIGGNAFYRCEKLKSVKLPDAITTLGFGVFDCCYSLNNIKLPATLTSIPESAFMYAALESITIPSSITEIGTFAFGDCSNLKEINVDADNSAYCSVDGVLFNKDKTMLQQYPTGKEDSTYIIPDSVKSIGFSAFGSCSALTEVIIPDSVTSIIDYAFVDCSALTKVTFKLCASLYEFSKAANAISK